MEAISLCESVKIDPSQILKLCWKTTPDIHHLVKAYQSSLLHIMGSLGEKEVNDLSMPIDHAAVVMHMEAVARSTISRPVLESLRKQFWFTSPEEQLNELELEIDQGRSALIFDPSGAPLRVVFIIALRVSRRGDEVLAQ